MEGELFCLDEVPSKLQRGLGLGLWFVLLLPTSCYATAGSARWYTLWLLQAATFLVLSAQAARHATTLPGYVFGWEYITVAPGERVREPANYWTMLLMLPLVDALPLAALSDAARASQGEMFRCFVLIAAGVLALVANAREIWTSPHSQTLSERLWRVKAIRPSPEDDATIPALLTAAAHAVAASAKHIARDGKRAPSGEALELSDSSVGEDSDEDDGGPPGEGAERRGAEEGTAGAMQMARGQSGTRRRAHGRSASTAVPRLVPGDGGRAGRRGPPLDARSY